ncbi:DoxX family protein [Kribbella sp. NBC_00709]|uniref:DoxX family protein n=1 Tax=Kribbella sp. NBC_00709 TaxID=2975972 RepID=UPI002E2A025D|nr:DoxX family protein [Kribbella sp. NBC_00709]
MSRSKTTTGLAVLFGVLGSLHFLKPEPFEQIVPKVLPRKKELVYASGVAELACAAGLLHPRTRRLAGLASAGLLVAVFPANVQMAADLQKKGSPTARALAYARLPLQVPLIRWALKAAREGRSG